MDNINKKLQALYDKYWSLATKVANNVIHDYGWSQDICQEVFVSLYQLVERQELNDDLIKYWLIVTTKHKAIDYCRKAYRKYETVGYEYGENESQEDANVRRSHHARACYVEDEMADDYIKKEFIKEMMEDLEEHNKNWHEIIEKSYVEQKDATESAGELGITVENVRTRLHRAKSWTQKRYQSEYDGL